MKYYSTNKNSHPVGLAEAVLKGLAADGGLYMPERIPLLHKDFFSSLHGMGLQEIGYHVVSAFLSEDVPDQVLEDMVHDTLSFDIPLVQVERGIYSLELFHGPTMAFKDVGARFMARLMAWLHHGKSLNSHDNNRTLSEAGDKVKKHTEENGGAVGSFAQSTDGQPETETAKPLKVIVATSGDTGSAVAAGFYNVPGIEVYVLFPKGKVSPLQQKQITTWGGNIHAIEVDGTFDDCQRMAKAVLSDKELNSRMLLTSANSINIARLIPQSIYYFYAAAQLPDPGLPLVFSVPSGNFGNLTAGLMAATMGLPVSAFVAATNINDVVPEYTRTGAFAPRSSVQTISNAMDVGNPSNFARMMMLFDGDHHRFCKSIYACAFTDNQTLEAIQQLQKESGYLADPHGAIAYMGAKQYQAIANHPTNIVFLETAHPAKFAEAITDVVGEVPLPPQLMAVKDKKEQYVSIGCNAEALAALLAG